MNRLITFALAISSCLDATEARLRGASVSSEHRLLEDSIVNGACTVDNFASAVGGTAKLASLLNVSNDATSMQEELDKRCESARNPTKDLSDTLGKGPQFLKNFLDGGTTWNDNYQTDDGSYDLSKDAAVIKTVYEESAKNVVFASPDGGANQKYSQYFSNFFHGDKECPLGVIECCYTGTRGDLALEDNADMCALDLTSASKSNHIKNLSYTFYDTQESNEAYCSGFAYEKGTFGDAVKYNTLFHMAMKSNLFDKGYVKNIPGAPMCGCVEQMPIVDNASCVKANEGYTIDESGVVRMEISWDDCDGKDLYSHYESLSKRSDMDKYFVKSKIVGKGECKAAAKSFMNDQMLVSTE